MDSRLLNDLNSLLNTVNGLIEAVNALVRTTNRQSEHWRGEIDQLKSQIDLVTTCDLKETESRIMSAISDFVAKIQTYNDQQDQAIAAIAGDVKNLTDTIAKIQGSPGPISPEDQASLDALTARAASVTAKLQALDALTPPPPPPTT